MVDPAIEQRTEELRALRATDPAQIIAYYQRIAAITPDGQLPPGVSFGEMIQTILIHEVRCGKLALSRQSVSESTR